MTAYISTRDLVKEYVLGRERVRAVDGITLDIERGSFVGIVGRSGSGKSTLLNLLGGLDHPSGGQIVVDGTVVNSARDDELARYRREKVGFVFQFFNLVPSLTARANVELPMIFGRIPRAERSKRAREILERVGLGHRLDHRPSELSGGEQQRVAIARALSMDPALVLADEPTGNLDSRTASDVMDLLRRLNQDHRHTVLLITHEREIARAYCTRLVELSDGKIIHDGPPASTPTPTPPPVATPAASVPAASPAPESGPSTENPR
ncbi:MAG: ABC transporter ATP-binding protein [Planctomycetes bacterium]|nr:ABC transporter ATP-binding protein [Planctomycetota bacterium]